MALSDMPLETVVATGDETSYVDWPAILAGTVIATAISLLFLTFGSALGLSLTSAYEGEGMSLVWFSIAAALWLLWVQISGFFAGGYLAGRLRRRKHDATEHESDIRDGSHGLIVWGLGILLGALIALSGIGTAVSTATSAAGTAVAGVADAASEAVDPNALLVDRMLRTGSTDAAAAPEAGTAPAPEAGAALAPEAGPATPAPAAATSASAEDPRDQIGRVIVSSVVTGTLEDTDRQYLVSQVATTAGIPQAEAEQRVDAMWEQAQQIEAEARAAADRARQIAMIGAFIAAASLLISAAAAYYAATLGGNHRDKQTVFSDWSRPWK